MLFVFMKQEELTRNTQTISNLLAGKSQDYDDEFQKCSEKDSFDYDKFFENVAISLDAEVDENTNLEMDYDSFLDTISNKIVL